MLGMVRIDPLPLLSNIILWMSQIDHNFITIAGDYCRLSNWDPRCDCLKTANEEARAQPPKYLKPKRKGHNQAKIWYWGWQGENIVRYWQGVWFDQGESPTVGVPSIVEAQAVSRKSRTWCIHRLACIDE